MRMFRTSAISYALTAGITLSALGLAPRAHAQLFVSDFSAGGSISEYSFGGSFIRTFVAGGSGGLSSPSNLTFGPDGNLYVASSGTGSIKNYNGTTGAYIGDVVTGLSTPYDVQFGADGFLYAPSFGSSSVVKVNAGTGAIVQTYTSGIHSPEGITFQANGNLIVGSGTGFDPVSIDKTTGTSTTFATGIGANVGVTSGPDARFYFTDYSAGTIRVASAAGGATSQFSVGGSLFHPQYLVFGNGSVYAASLGNSTVQFFNAATGVFQSSFSAPRAAGVTIRGTGAVAAPEPGSLALAGFAFTGIFGRVIPRCRKSVVFA